MPRGIGQQNRVHLDTLHRVMKGPFSAAGASDALKLPLPRARRLLSWLENQGWLARVRHGLYALVPLGATAPSAWREDPWLVATKVFAPCYIGGWSACEHWGLTEQVFRGVVVVSAKPLRSAEQEIQGTPFILRHASARRLFGLHPVWRAGVRTQVSDPSRTVVDVLSDPSIGGGIQHTLSIVREYLGSEHRKDRLFLEYALRLGNRAVFKRLGYLLEFSKLDAPLLVAECFRERSEGISLLDPTVRSNGGIVKRWRLRVNVRLQDEVAL